jgi:gliding-associated putative ABC transporter substrate-binding component GldG
MKTKSSVYKYILMFTGIVLLVNILSYRYFLRFDFTADKRYTLSRATRDILSGIQEPVTIKAYFSKELPPQIDAVRTDFKDLLVEYKTASKGMVQYAFSDPGESPELEQQAMQAGIQPVIIDSREKDKSVQKKAFLGALIEAGEKSQRIPVIQPGAAMEYELSTAIKKIITTNKPGIAFLQGHKEPGLEEMGEVMQALSVLYTATPVTLSDTADALAGFNTAVIIAPRDSFSDGYFRQMDAFLSRGGNLVIAMDRVDGNLGGGYPMGTSINTGLEKWLGKKGLLVHDNFVIDTKCSEIGVRQQMGGFTMQSSVAFPYFPIISSFDKNPISKGLEAVMMPFASSMEFHGDSMIQYIPLARTSEKSGYRMAPVVFDINNNWQEEDFKQAGLVVAALLQGKLSGNLNSRLVVFGSGKFAVNGREQQAVQLAPDNVNFLVNAIDYLSDKSGLMELRTKGVTSRPLKELKDTSRTLWKYFNFLFPILVILGYGLYRSQHNRNIRMKRMEEGYV